MLVASDLFKGGLKYLVIKVMLDLIVSTQGRWLERFSLVTNHTIVKGKGTITLFSPGLEPTTSILRH